MAGRKFRPLTPDRLDDLADLFGSDGVTRNCWCMWWRLKTSAFDRMRRPEREAAFRARVERGGHPPGLLGYEDDVVIGWVQVTPRAELPRFNRSRIARPVEPDLEDVWAISCFFVRKGQRRKGLMVDLARAACSFAVRHGARAIEAAALDPIRPVMWGEGYVGLASALSRAGFVEVERRSKSRILMRWTPGTGQAE